MNIQTTKMELIKIITGIDSQQLLNRMKVWLSLQVESNNTLRNEPKQPEEDSALVTKDGFLIFTGVLEGGFDNLLKDTRSSREVNLL